MTAPQRENLKAIVDRAIQSAINRQANSYVPCLADRLAISLAGKSQPEIVRMLREVTDPLLGPIARQWLGAADKENGCGEDSAAAQNNLKGSTTP